MGIRYYAYAFDADQAEAALADPMNVIGEDPLADAWGMQPGFSVGVMGERSNLPERDLLYLDKAWRPLQDAIGAIASARQRGAGTVLPGRRNSPLAAHRMFEGDVTMNPRGWVPFTRTITPVEVVEVAKSLALLGDHEIEEALLQTPNVGESDACYALHFLGRARTFVARAAEDERGFAYLIG